MSYPANEEVVTNNMSTVECEEKPIDSSENNNMKETYGQKLVRNAYAELAKPSHQQLLVLPILRFIFKIAQPFVVAMGSILLVIVVLQIICVVQLHIVHGKCKTRAQAQAQTQD